MDMKRKKAIAARLAAIAEASGGRLTPAAVVEDARDPSSPLHDAFTWDDARAAHQYRLDQARHLIRSVRVEVTEETRTVSSVFYVRDPDVGEGQGYVETASLKGDAERARMAVVGEVSRVLGLLERARSVASQLGLEAELEELLERTAKLRRRLDEAGDRPEV